MAVKKSGCRKFMRLGDSACRKCNNRTCEHPEPEDDESEEEEEEEEPEEEEPEEEEPEEGDDTTYSDSFGNENMKHVFTIPVEEFIWRGRRYSGTICVAADTAEDAKDWLEEQDPDELFGGLDGLECLDCADLTDEGPVGEDAEHLSCKGDVSDIEETDDEELRD